MYILYISIDIDIDVKTLPLWTFSGVFFEKPNRHDCVDLTLCSSTSLGILVGSGFSVATCHRHVIDMRKGNMVWPTWKIQVNNEKSIHDFWGLMRPSLEFGEPKILGTAATGVLMCHSHYTEDFVSEPGIAKTHASMGDFETTALSKPGQNLFIVCWEGWWASKSLLLGLADHFLP